MVAPKIFLHTQKVEGSIPVNGNSILCTSKRSSHPKGRGFDSRHRQLHFFTSKRSRVRFLPTSTSFCAHPKGRRFNSRHRQLHFAHIQKAEGSIPVNGNSILCTSKRSSHPKGRGFDSRHRQ